jgi:hypothetical protein
VIFILIIYALSFHPFIHSFFQVRGTSAGTPQVKALTPKPPSTAKTDEKEELGLVSGNGIVDEVLALLGRLETDRVNTEQTIQKERERVQQLRKAIDQHAYKRMQELPVCVQRGRYLK